jgi:hypothetical protein
MPDIYDKLQPRIYCFKDDSLKRVHFGFYAQEVEEALLEANIPRLGLIVRGKKNGYALDYTELIALNTWQI